eukprot:COSAG02_NODE_57659_length_280_cov_0.563536_1_plen_61_part_00
MYIDACRNHLLAALFGAELLLLLHASARLLPDVLLQHSLRPQKALTKTSMTDAVRPLTID